MASFNVSLIIPLMEAQPGRRAGGKAINLSRLIAAHFVVPRGFVISADAYRSHLWASGAREIASNAVEAEDREKIREAILAADISEDVWKSITDAYGRLSLQLGLENPSVAVRSSAVEDGLAEISFPGAYESILNVGGQDALKMAIKRVWASLWGGKASAYRMRCGTTAEPAMAVIIQQMMDGQWSGTALTADSVTGNRNRVMVSCSTFANATDLSCYVVDLRTPSVVAAGDDLVGSPGESIITLLAEKAIVVEKTLGCPVAVEWTYEHDRLWILQAMPIRDIPPYFPIDQDSEHDVVWKRLTSKPVLFFARGSLCESERVRIVNGYAYEQTGTPDMSHMGKGIAEGLKLLEEWENLEYSSRYHTWRNEHKAHAAQNARFDPADACPGDLIRRARELSNDVKSLLGWMENARRFGCRFSEHLRRILPGALEDSSIYYRLLGGLPGRVIMRDARLQELAEQFRMAEKSGKINDQDWCKSYKTDVESFARDYGHSFTNLNETCDPASWESWVENSDIVFRMIAAMSRSSLQSSLITLHCAAEDDFRRAASELDLMIGSAKKAGLEKILRLSRGWLALGNECEMVLAHASAGLRLIMIELGHRLFGLKAIASKHDAFHLSLDEIAGVGNELNESQRNEIAALVTQRKHDIWLEQRLTSPDFLPSKMSASIQGSEITALSGIGVGTGTVTGCARIARSVEEASKIESGEILVVESAALAWTPFLAVAGGFVSEGECVQPGVESIIRTYGIPAVIGCKGIGAVQNGGRIMLDAQAGTVKINAQPSVGRSV